MVNIKEESYQLKRSMIHTHDSLNDRDLERAFRSLTADMLSFTSDLSLTGESLPIPVHFP